MKTRKIFPGICLLALFVSGLIPVAQAALVNTPGQPITLQGSSISGDTSGILPFSRLSRIKTDGIVQPFILPPNQSIVITWVNITINAVNTSLATNTDLRVGPFYSRAMTMNNGIAGFTEGLDPGFLINFQGFTDPRYQNFYTVDLNNGGIIPGTIIVKLIGYLIPVP